MEFDSQVYLLSQRFMDDYPVTAYPELMYKQGRPYTCLLLETHYNYFLCVPFRSSIQHKNAFLFSGTERSRKSRSGLDYSKTVVIRNPDYIDSTRPAVVDQDEYAELMRNLSTIVETINTYVTNYVYHKTEFHVLHEQEYARKYRFSTLPYFDDVLGIVPHR